MATYVQTNVQIPVWGDGSSLTMDVSLDAYLAVLGVPLLDTIQTASPVYPTQAIAVLAASGTNVASASINGTLVTITWSAPITGANTVSLVLGV